MAATIEQLRDYLRQMRTNSMDEVEIANRLFTTVANKVIDDYDQNRVSLEKAVDRIVELTREVQARVMELEQKRSKLIDERMGMESLTTDTKDKRDSEWFRQTGKAFATGMAKFCVVVAVTHDEIGMGASHRNTYNETVFRHVTTRTLQDKNYRERLSRDENLFLKALSPNLLNGTISVTLHEALGEFATMTSDHLLPRSGTIISVAGIEFLNHEQIDSVEQFVQQAVSRSPYLSNTGQIKGIKREVGLNYSLGQKRGVIYGGPDHPNPDYRKPTFYKLEIT